MTSAELLALLREAPPDAPVTVRVQIAYDTRPDGQLVIVVKQPETSDETPKPLKR